MKLPKKPKPIQPATCTIRPRHHGVSVIKRRRILRLGLIVFVRRFGVVVESGGGYAWVGKVHRASVSGTKDI